jgi:hypothetical protein
MRQGEIEQQNPEVRTVLGHSILLPVKWSGVA